MCIWLPRLFLVGNTEYFLLARKAVHHKGFSLTSPAENADQIAGRAADAFEYVADVVDVKALFGARFVGGYPFVAIAGGTHF